MKKILLIISLVSLNIFSAQMSQAEEKAHQEKLDLEKTTNGEKFFKLFNSKPEFTKSLLSYVSKAGSRPKPNQNIINLISQLLIQFINNNELNLNITQIFKLESMGWGGKLELDPLRCAILLGNLDLIKLLVSKKTDLNNILDGMPPLSFSFHATQFNRNDVVKLLLDSGANPNLKIKSGNTPLRSLIHNYCLYYVNCSGDNNLIKLMFDYGANHKLPNDEGETVEQFINKFKRFSPYGEGVNQAEKAVVIENENLYWRAFVTGIIHSMKVLNPIFCRMIADYSSNR